jgi:hypothetical protein
MIEKDFEGNYVLTCDHCGDECDDTFETFQDAVDFRKDRDNGWKAVKDFNGEWNDLCPSCNQPDINLKLRAQ